MYDTGAVTNYNVRSVMNGYTPSDMAFFTDGSDDYLFTAVKDGTYYCIFVVKTTDVPFDASAFDTYSHSYAGTLVAIKPISSTQAYAFL